MNDTGIPHGFTAEQMKFLEAYLFMAYRREEGSFTKGIWPPHSFLGSFTRYFNEDLLIEVANNLQVREYIKVFPTRCGVHERVAVQLTHKCLLEMATAGRIAPRLMALFGDATPPVLYLPSTVEKYRSLKRAFDAHPHDCLSFDASLFRILEDLLADEPEGGFPEPEPSK